MRPVANAKRAAGGGACPTPGDTAISTRNYTTCSDANVSDGEGDPNGTVGLFDEERTESVVRMSALFVAIGRSSILARE